MIEMEKTMRDGHKDQYLAFQNHQPVYLFKIDVMYALFELRMANKGIEAFKELLILSSNYTINT